MYCKVHTAANKTVLAASDADIIGKTLMFGDVEFHVSEAFYKGKKVSESELSKLLDEHNNINLIGEKVVSVALKKGLISERSIIKIQGIPHVQIYRLV
ncbi:MAG: DUF424 family protein [Candidatus Diapherotrites archaeon]|nr:DUF424 family protein [Candidatus Diapherotrites archaeon]